MSVRNNLSLVDTIADLNSLANAGELINGDWYLINTGIIYSYSSSAGLTFVGSIASSNLINSLLGKRPKIATFGNSLNNFSMLGGGISSSPIWTSQGKINWISALTQCGFDRCRSNSYNWGLTAGSGDASTEGLDQWGNYAFSGARLSNAFNSAAMINHLAAACDLFIDTPDIVYLNAMLENDIGNPADWNWNFNSGYPAITKAINQSIQIIQSKWPNAIIIYSAPAPSLFYTAYVGPGGSSALNMYNYIYNYLVNTVPAKFKNVLIEVKQSILKAGGQSGQPDTRYLTVINTATQTVAITAGQGTNVITVASATGLSGPSAGTFGSSIIGPNIPFNTFVTNINGSIVTLNNSVGATASYFGIGDGVHHNTSGALQEALEFVGNFGWLFPNTLSLSNLPNNPNIPPDQQQSFVLNPDFTRIGAPGTSPGAGSLNGGILDQQYYSFDWYPAGNAAQGIIPNIKSDYSLGGVDITLNTSYNTGPNGGVPIGGNYGCGWDNDLIAVNVNTDATYMYVAQCQILNGVNLNGILLSCQFNGGSQSVSATSMQAESNYATYFPLGIGGMLAAGTKLTITTPPILPLYSNNNDLYNSGSITANINLTPTSGNAPAVNFSCQNIILTNPGGIKNTLTLASSISVAGSGGSNGSQTFTVASPTGIAVGQMITGTNIPQFSYVEAISGTTVTASQALTGAVSGNVLFDNLYRNRSTGKQSVIINTAGVTITTLKLWQGSNVIAYTMSGDENLTLAPGQAFSMQWSAGTPVFTVLQLD